MLTFNTFGWLIQSVFYSRVDWNVLKRNQLDAFPAKWLISYTATFSPLMPSICFKSLIPRIVSFYKGMFTRDQLPEYFFSKKYYILALIVLQKSIMGQYYGEKPVRRYWYWRWRGILYIATFFVRLYNCIKN